MSTVLDMPTWRRCIGCGVFTTERGRRGEPLCPDCLAPEGVKVRIYAGWRP